MRLAGSVMEEMNDIGGQEWEGWGQRVDSGDCKMEWNWVIGYESHNYIQ